jgi:aspartate/methionine/tyrosine aminotransferase
MFSSRLPADFAPNRLTRAIADLRGAGRPFLDLTESNPTLAGFAYPADLLAALSDTRALVYRPSPSGHSDARRAIAADYARRGVHVPADRLLLTASTSEAYSMLFKVLCDPGDEVLVPRPSYPLFEYLTRLDAVRAVPYDLEYHGVWAIDLEGIERAWSPRTRALLAVHPNNPTGSFVTPRELDRMAALAATHGAAIVADEVFADYALPPGPAEGVAQMLAARDALVFGLGGLSKSIGLPQAKLAWIAVAGPDAAAGAAIARLEIACDAYLSVSTPVQLAAAALLARGADLRRQIQARIGVNYARLASLVAAAPACELLRADGGWSAVLRVPTVASEEELAIDLLSRRGVLVHPGYFFDFLAESYLVVSLIVGEVEFAEGVSRVLEHFAAPHPAAPQRAGAAS